MTMHEAFPPPPGRGSATAVDVAVRGRTRRGFLKTGLVILAVGLAISGSWYAGERLRRRDVDRVMAQLEMERSWKDALERELTEAVARLSADRQDLRSRLEVRGRELDRLARTVQALEGERGASERILATYASGVPLIQGVLVFEDQAGRPLRYARVDARGRPVPGPHGWPQMSAEGEGPVVRMTFLGTGFLVSRAGAILTSRHVIRPWAADPILSESLQLEGATPRVAQLRAFFPDVPDPVPLKAVKASATTDLIVLQGNRPRSASVLPLDFAGADAVPGRPVIVLGYPAGLELLLARVPLALLETLIDHDVTEITDTTVDVPALLEKLSRLNQIRPYPTWGRLADKRPHQLAHDAGTSVGGSGGPIFSASGRVIGLSTAVARDFDGAALGVPIREAMAPLAVTQRTGTRGRMP